MPRWALQYEERKQRPPARWTLWRILSWTLLFGAIGFWFWVSLAGKG